jgi:hypothetical protein
MQIQGSTDKSSVRLGWLAETFTFGDRGTPNKAILLDNIHTDRHYMTLNVTLGGKRI